MLDMKLVLLFALALVGLAFLPDPSQGGIDPGGGQQITCTIDYVSPTVAAIVAEPLSYESQGCTFAEMPAEFTSFSGLFRDHFPDPGRAGDQSTLSQMNTANPHTAAMAEVLLE